MGTIEDALAAALIDALRFLEFGTVGEVDPDSVVRCMENIASNLLQLDVAQQAALRASFVRLAGRPDEANPQFVREIPDMVGLAA